MSNPVSHAIIVVASLYLLSIYDGTAQNPDWLGEEPQRIQQLMSARP